MYMLYNLSLKHILILPTPMEFNCGIAMFAYSDFIFQIRLLFKFQRVILICARSRIITIYLTRGQDIDEI